MLTRKDVEHTLALIVDHSLRAWKSSDEVQMMLDHDAALRAQVDALTKERDEAQSGFRMIKRLSEMKNNRLTA